MDLIGRVFTAIFHCSQIVLLLHRHMNLILVIKGKGTFEFVKNFLTVVGISVHEIQLLEEIFLAVFHQTQIP